jgi:large subunit ribosomal protein L4
MDVPVYNIEGAQVGTMTVDETSLGGEVNPALIKQAFVMYHANRRQGSARTKSRGEVDGSTRKLYRQKGTGRARAGSLRTNIRRGGGHSHHKNRTREDFRQSMPKKMRRKANRNALLAKLVDAEVKIIDDLGFDRPRTKAFTGLLEKLGIDRTVLVAVSTEAESGRNAALSARNIDDVTLCRASDMNCFDLMNHRYLLIGRGDLEAWLTGPTSQTGKDAKINPMGRLAAEAE